MKLNYILVAVLGALVGTIYSASAQQPVKAMVTPLPCATILSSGASPHAVTTVNTTAVPVPASPLAARKYVVVCNSRENASGNVKCRSDGTAPVFVAGAGDMLAVGDCVAYSNAAYRTTTKNVQCIASAAMYVTSYECE